MKDKAKADKFTLLKLIKAFWYLAKGRRLLYFGTALFSYLINSYFIIVPPLVLGKVIDIFTKQKTAINLQTFFNYLLILAISYAVITYIQMRTKILTAQARADITYMIGVRGFEKLLSYSLRWHSQELSGEKAQRIQNGVASFNLLSTIFENQMVQIVSTFYATLIIFSFLSYKYFLFFVFYLMILFFLIRKYYKRINQINKEYYTTTEKVVGAHVEGLNNVLTIKALGASDSFVNHVAEKEQLKKSRRYLMIDLHNVLWRNFEIANGFCYSTFLLFIGFDVYSGKLTTGSIVIFYGYFQGLVYAAMQLLTSYEHIVNGKNGLGRMMPIFWDDNYKRIGGRDFPKNWKKITIKNASFSYIKNSIEKDRDLKDIDFHIKRNEKIGIVGKTGSGKSTLAKLLVGLYDFNKGEYKVDGLDFYKIDPELVLRNMVLVLQESEMFNLSLKENVTLMKDVNSDLLNKTFNISQLLEVIQKLPKGVDTLIGEKGHQLSGGERQRLGIARAIYMNSPMIILDEATSALDNKTESILQSELESLNKKTMIIIAHRISTLKNVDRIYVFENGQIVEEGKYEELLKNKDSHFVKIYEGKK